MTAKESLIKSFDKLRTNGNYLIPFVVSLSNHQQNRINQRLPKNLHGFTLVEMIVAIVITGIAAAMVGMFIRSPIQSYTDSVNRAELTDTADTALRRMARDLHLAVPNSVQVNVSGATSYLEFLQTRTGGRYRSEDDCPGGVCAGKDILSFDAADTSFEVLGEFPGSLPVAGDRVVIFNTGQAGADAYNGDNTSTVSAASAATITFASKLFPFDSPSKHFQVIETPVTYVCTPGAVDAVGNATGTLTRYSGYAIRTPAASAPAGGTGATLLANNVLACTITQPEALPQPGYALVTMRLVLTRNNESATLYHEAHVNNVP
ncbi:MAG: type II secretion system protein [Sulfuricellaceae bacterium]|nr:type II secretion system protein [Sulfuricellaceae bacterium]